ncbi:MAG: HEAT repeat domain-containing protein [Planctomycetota bacterium]|jgi:hypothetical protein
MVNRKKVIILLCMAGFFVLSGCSSLSVKEITAKVKSLKPQGGSGKIKTVQQKKTLEGGSGKSPVLKVVKGESAFEPLMQRFIPDEVPALPANSPIDLSGKRVEFTASQIIESGDYASLLLGNMEYGKRREAFDKLRQNPDRKAESALVLVLQTKDDPFSRYAIPLLAGFNTARSDSALINALADARPTIRATSLIALVSKKNPGAGKLCHEALAMDKSGLVKCAAAVGIGGLKYEAARGTLHMAVQKAVPMVRLFSAWAIYELGDQNGRTFIENVAAAQDGNLSPQAMTIIAHFRDSAAADSLLALLGSMKSGIWATAYLSLGKMPADIISGKLDIPYPDIREGRRFMNTVQRKRRRASLLAIELSLKGNEKQLQARYSLLNQTASSGSPKELELMSKVLAADLSNRAIEPLIRMLASEDKSLVESTKKILSSIAQKYKLSPTPDYAHDKDQWRIWWIENCYVRVVKDSRSRKLIFVIKSPDGIDYFAAKGVMIVPGVKVVEVDKKFRKSLRLSVSFNNRIYQIKEQ